MTQGKSSNAHPKGAGLLQGLALSLLLLSTMACAQVPSMPVQSDAYYSAESQFPVMLLGTRTLQGRGFVADSDLTFEAQSLSWGFCENAPYRVLRQAGETYLVQFLLASPACQFGGIASFLIVEPAEHGIDVSICRDPREFAKPRGDRQCSHGVLVRRSIR